MVIKLIEVKEKLWPLVYKKQNGNESEFLEISENLIRIGDIGCVQSVWIKSGIEMRGEN